MHKHVTALGALLIGFGIIALLMGASISFLVAGAGMISGDEEAIFITSVVATAIAAFFAIAGFPAIVAGIGLLKRWNWCRLLTLIVAALNIFNFPFGTALALYAFWVLSQDDVGAVFAKPSSDDPPPPASTSANGDEVMAAT